jgi:hypothetical protein
VRADLARFCARRVEIAEQDRRQLAPALDEIDEPRQLFVPFGAAKSEMRRGRKRRSTPPPLCTL